MNDNLKTAGYFLLAGWIIIIVNLTLTALAAAGVVGVYPGILVGLFIMCTILFGFTLYYTWKA